MPQQRDRARRDARVRRVRAAGQDDGNGRADDDARGLRVAEIFELLGQHVAGFEVGHDENVCIACDLRSDDRDLGPRRTQCVCEVDGVLHDVDLGGEVGRHVHRRVGDQQRLGIARHVEHEDVAHPARGAQSAIGVHRLGEQLVGVQAALHQGSQLALAGHRHGLCGGAVAVRRFDQGQSGNVDVVVRRETADARRRSDQHCLDQPESRRIDRALERVHAAGMHDPHADRRVLCRCSEQSAVAQVLVGQERLRQLGALDPKLPRRGQYLGLVIDDDVAVLVGARRRQHEAVMHIVERAHRQRDRQRVADVHGFQELQRLPEADRSRPGEAALEHVRTGVVRRVRCGGRQGIPHVLLKLSDATGLSAFSSVETLRCDALRWIKASTVVIDRSQDDCSEVESLCANAHGVNSRALMRALQGPRSAGTGAGATAAAHRCASSLPARR